MIVYRGGQRAAKGAYLRWAEGEWVTVPAGGGPLPGLPGDRYLSMPAAAVLAPILGLVYFVFIPLVGVFSGGWLLLRALVARSRRAIFAGRRHSHSTTFI